MLSSPLEKDHPNRLTSRRCVVRHETRLATFPGVRYTQAGTPTLAVTNRGVADGRYSFAVAQTAADTPDSKADAKQPFHIPIARTLRPFCSFTHVTEGSSIYPIWRVFSEEPQDMVANCLRALSRSSLSPRPCQSHSQNPTFESQIDSCA